MPSNFRQQYIKLFPQLNEALRHINSKLSDLPPDDFHLETGLKPYRSAKRKALTDQIKKLHHLSDLARGRIYFSSNFEFDDVLAIIKKLFGEQVAKVEPKQNTTHQESCLEYNGVVHIDLNIDGIPVELQVIPQEFEPYKDFLHSIYEKVRNPNTKLNDKQKKFLCKTHNGLYSKLNEEANKNRKEELFSENYAKSNMQKRAQVFRQAILLSNQGLKKVAFDTRRINQEIEYNPRRGLQNYVRSEAFISEELAKKIKTFAKLRDVLNELKIVYEREHEWQDSNVRVLLSTLNIGLRAEAKDGDYAVNQPGMGSFDYIEELLHMRYRLGFDEITRLSNEELKTIILSKDEGLTRKDVKLALENKSGQTEMFRHSYDMLMDKLFTVAAPTDVQPVCERTVTITIRDSLPNKLPDKVS